MRGFKAISFLALLALLPVTGPAIAKDSSAPQKVQILTLIDDSQPLGFMYVSRGRSTTTRMINIFGGIAPFLINNSVNKKAVEKDSAEFQRTIGAYDRRTVLERKFAAMIGNFSPWFTLVAPKPDRRKEYLHDGKPNFSAIEKDGWRYVLVIKDKFTGMATSQAGSVSAYSDVDYAVYDVAKEKKLGKGEAVRIWPTQHDYASAMRNRKIFVSEYPQLANMVATGVLGQLLKDDVFYRIGQKENLGDKVPAVAKILADYEKRFNYDFDLPRGWKKQKYNAKYRLDMGPKKDWSTVGDGFSVDLLLEAFGSKTKTLSEYKTIFLGRVANMGYPVETVHAFRGLKIDPSWNVFAMERPDRRGPEIVAMKKIGDFVFVHSFVFLSDYETNFAKYKSDIEYLMAHARYTVDGK